MVRNERRPTTESVRGGRSAAWRWPQHRPASAVASSGWPPPSPVLDPESSISGPVSCPRVGERPRSSAVAGRWGLGARSRVDRLWRRLRRTGPRALRRVSALLLDRRKLLGGHSQSLAPRAEPSERIVEPKAMQDPQSPGPRRVQLTQCCPRRSKLPSSRLRAPRTTRRHQATSAPQ